MDVEKIGQAVYENSLQRLEEEFVLRRKKDAKGKIPLIRKVSLMRCMESRFEKGLIATEEDVMQTINEMELVDSIPIYWIKHYLLSLSVSKARNEKQSPALTEMLSGEIEAIKKMLKEWEEDQP